MALCVIRHNHRYYLSIILFLSIKMYCKGCCILRSDSTAPWPGGQTANLLKTYDTVGIGLPFYRHEPLQILDAALKRLVINLLRLR